MILLMAGVTIGQAGFRSLLVANLARERAR